MWRRHPSHIPRLPYSIFSAHLVLTLHLYVSRSTSTVDASFTLFSGAQFFPPALSMRLHLMLEVAKGNSMLILFFSSVLVTKLIWVVCNISFYFNFYRCGIPDELKSSSFVCKLANKRRLASRDSISDLGYLYQIN